MFSTITSPVFSELAVVIENPMAANLRLDLTLFETLGKMNEVRPFKLVFLTVASVFSREKVRWELAEALDFVIAEGLLDFLDSPPTMD